MNPLAQYLLSTNETGHAFGKRIGMLSPATVWRWTRPFDHPLFKRPGAGNIARIDVLTSGAVNFASWYPPPNPAAAASPATGDPIDGGVERAAILPTAATGA